ncbi:MAG: 30S ribosomal protein S4 [Candidatus Aenigmatarchaeota archaeon]
MRNIRNKFKKPRVPWNIIELKKDRQVMNKYGLRRKKELWLARESLRQFRQRARKLISANDQEKEKILIDKMLKFGLLQKGQGLDDILALDITNILDRRLQTVVLKRGIAKAIKESRQMITHGHIIIEGRRNKFPSYMVPIEQEGNIIKNGGG